MTRSSAWGIAASRATMLLALPTAQYDHMPRETLETLCNGLQVGGTFRYNDRSALRNLASPDSWARKGPITIGGSKPRVRRFFLNGANLAPRLSPECPPRSLPRRQRRDRRRARRRQAKQALRQKIFRCRRPHPAQRRSSRRDRTVAIIRHVKASLYNPE